MDNINNESSNGGLNAEEFACDVVFGSDEFDVFEDSENIINQDNRDSFNEPVKLALSDLLAIDPEYDLAPEDSEEVTVIDSETDQEVLEAIESADSVTGTLFQRTVGNPNIVPNKDRPNIPNYVPAQPNASDVCRSMWSAICLKGAQMRFCAAVEVCSSRVGTLQETAQYLLKCFPVLKRFNFDEKMFTTLCETIPDVAEAWGFGEFGDEVGDRYMISLAKKVATQKYNSGELTVSELHKYAQMRDVLEGIKVRQQLADLKCSQDGIGESSESNTNVIFKLERRDDNE